MEEKELSVEKMLEMVITLKDPKYVFSGIRLSYKKRLTALEWSLLEKAETAKNPDEMRAFAKILVNFLHRYSKESKRTRELFMHALAMGGMGFFDKFIVDLLQSSRIGASIALHNCLVYGDFKERGLNWENWLKFGGVEEKIVEIQNHLEGELRWCRVQVSLRNLLKSFENSELYHCLRKDIILLENQRKLFSSCRLRVGDDWQERFFPKFFAGLAHLEKKGRASVLTGHQVMFFSEAGRDLALVYQKPMVKKFSVRLWKRDPRIDLFQGNHSDCCIGIGGRPAVRLPGVIYKNYPAGILDYLIDQGIQVAQVEVGGNIVGQCWLFVGVDQLFSGAGGGNKEPFLMADSFDLGEKCRGLSTASQRKVNRAIRSCMFDFLKRYAEAVGLKKIYLGKNGPLLENGTIHTIGNAVETDDLPVRTLERSIEKLGGYWLKQPYFLETRGGTKVFVIKE